MNKAKRRPMIAGNWKMNLTAAKTAELVAEMLPLVRNADCGVTLCVPFTDLAAANKALANSNVKLGAQNCHWENSGAYTGEISAEMLVEAGCEYVIIGHSERRQYFGETDATVNARAKAALARGLKVILCVGETLDQREQNITNDVIRRQTTEGLAGITPEQLGTIVLAYEPVWAIGTGKTATSQQAGEVCGFIRGIVGELYTQQAAEGMAILYGGSMNAKNAAELLSQGDIDGGLIGGASLKAVDFSEIVKAASLKENN